MTREIRNAWGLMGIAVVFWGLNWPVMKIGIDHIGPLWFAALRVLLSAIVLFAFLGLRRRVSLPTRSELPVLLSVGGVQIGICMALLHASLLFVDAGRAAVLAYTIPLWAAPMAILFLGEKLTARKALGIGLGGAGIAVLFNPLSFPWGWNAPTFGNALPLISAVLWAAVLVHVRAHGWRRPHLSLLPWQLLIGGIVLSGVALVGEGLPRLTPSFDLLWILGYNALVATVLCFWCYIGAARVLPANTTAISSLGIPVVGLISSAVFLGEPLTPTTLGGMALIAAGIVASSLDRGKPLIHTKV
ncbi:DMT family transporter [Magnetospira thiophila]